MKFIEKAVFVLIVLFVSLCVGCKDAYYTVIEQAGDIFDSEKVKEFIDISEEPRHAPEPYYEILSRDGTGEHAVEGSTRHRIPTMVVIPPNSVLPNGQRLGSKGRVYLTGDLRWGANNDLPHKASIFGRFSDDAGETWSNPQVISHYDDLDMTALQSGVCNTGVNTGDPAIGRTADNHLIILSTFEGQRTGNSYTTANTGHAHFKIDDNWYLRLAKNETYWTFNGDSIDWSDKDKSFTTNTTNICTLKSSLSFSERPAESKHATDSSFDYAVPVKGGEIVNLSNSASPSLPGGNGTGIYVDEYYYLYHDPDFRKPLYIPQLTGSGGKTISSSQETHAHLFMLLSPFMPWRGCNYIGMSVSADGGITWSKHKDITYMVRPQSEENQALYFLCPTGGYLHDGMSDEVAADKGGNKRLLFSAYNTHNNESPVVFWTEDNGETWTVSADDMIDNGYKMSETSIIGVPEDGTLIAVSRSGSNSAGAVRYATSDDGGDTWIVRGELPYSSGKLCVPQANLVSVTPLRLTVGPKGEPLVALSTSTIKGSTSFNRANGRVYVAALEKGGDGAWTFNPYFMGGNAESCLIAEDLQYAYSCVRELPNGNLINVWEGLGSTSLRLTFVDLVRKELE